MKFIKEMITRKQNESEPVNIEEMSAMIDDVKADDTSGADMFNNLAAIQARIKTTQSDVGKDAPLSEKLRPKPDVANDVANTDQVAHFADLVAEIKAPASGGGDGDDAVKDQRDPDLDPDLEPRPIMTEEDFSQLDQELAQMADVVQAEIEAHEVPEAPEPQQPQQQLDAPAKSETNALEPAMHGTEPVTEPPEATPEVVPADVKADAGIPDAVEMNGPDAVEMNGRNTEPEAAPAEIPEPATIFISEKQGGGAVTPKEPDEVGDEPPSPEVKDTAPEKEKVASAPHIVEVPAPAAGRSGRRAGRVKTRLLGFEHSQGGNTDPFSATRDVVASPQVSFPVGWIVITDGPGLGTAFTLFNGVSQIGRGEDQAIRLDFGDSSISRDNHAAIAYDNEHRAFYLGHGGKANLVRLNSKPVLSTEEISNNDKIRIGETTLRFISLCGGDFDWGDQNREEHDDAATA